MAEKEFLSHTKTLGCNNLNRGTDMLLTRTGVGLNIFCKRLLFSIARNPQINFIKPQNVPFLQGPQTYPKP